MELDSTLIGFMLSTAVVLVAVGAAWGSLRSAVRASHHRLDRINGRLDHHGERLDNHGERIARIEGGHSSQPATQRPMAPNDGSGCP